MNIQKGVKKINASNKQIDGESAADNDRQLFLAATDKGRR